MKCLTVLPVIFALTATALAAESPVEPKVKDAVRPLAPGAVTLEGHLADRLGVCIENRIKAQSIADLIEPFQKREETRLWRSEFWGKWFMSAAWAYRYSQDPQLKTILDKAVAELLATQTPDGYLGTYTKQTETDNWDIWGRKYTLLGLMSYYDLTGDKKVLAAARRHADYLLSQVGPGKRDIAKLGWWSGMAAGSILEPMVLLYNATGDRRYLDFAQYIVERWESPEGPKLLNKSRGDVLVFDMFDKPKPVKKNYGDYGQSKAYEMMSCYEGLCELYRVTGTPAYREAAEKLFPNILATEITVVGSGSNMERWCDGHRHQVDRSITHWMETCVTVTWMKLCYQLYRISGEAKYMDEIERSVYNALLGAQKLDGTWWSHYSPMDGLHGPAPEHCGMHQNCCVANGPRAMALLPMLSVMTNDDGPVVNLYGPSTANAVLQDGTKVQLRQITDYPKTGTVDVVVTPERAAAFTLSLRIPGWSEQTTVSVNDEPVDNVAAGSYLRLARTWKPGDRVRLAFDFRSRVVPVPDGQSFVALLRGPIVLAMDKRITRPVEGATAARLKTDAQGFVNVRLVDAQQPASVWMQFDVPMHTADGRDVAVQMCDFGSAGQTWDEDSLYRVWLPVPADLSEPLADVPHHAGAH